MNNTTNKSGPKTTCDIHLSINGQVERTIKENGIVKRVRRCPKCNELFKTIEETEDHQVREDKRRAELMEDWHRKVRESEVIKDQCKLFLESLERLEELVRVAPGPEEWENEYPGGG